MSFDSQVLLHALMNGLIDSATLNTQLAQPAILGAWKSMLISRDIDLMFKTPDVLDILFGSSIAFGSLLDIAGEEIAASDYATELVSNNTSSILSVVTNVSYLDLWQNVSANKTRLLARVNASGSKLKNWTFTSSGTWTVTGLQAYSYFINGSGGAGGAASSGNGSGSGGSGSESKWGQVTSGMPGSNQSITVGSNTNSSIGSLHSATKGNDGSGNAGTITGPGSNTGTSPYDTNFGGEIWQPYTGTAQGASGGGSRTAASAPSTGFNGGNGITGSGGSGGGPGNGGSGGSGFGSGGGGGGVDSGFGGGSGSSGSNYGSGGGGGGLRGGDAGAGASGSPGYVSINGVVS